MRSLLRPIATCLLATGVATCSDTPIATVKSSAAPTGIGRAALSLQPAFTRSAQQAADLGVTFDSVHIVIRGLPDTTRIVLDTTIVFRPDSPDLRLDLSVPVRAEGERFDAGLGYTLGGVIQFYGHGTVQSHAPNAPPPPEPQITINYQGPGSKVARLSISPRTTSLLGTQSSTLTVAAFDSAGASMTPPPLLWSTSNASIVSVSTSGTVQGQNRRGTATITVQAPTGISDNVPVNVTLPAASIALVSGGGQTGNAGATLSNPGVVQVSASDGVGVAGASVVFGAPAGGSVSPTTATTDANGRASVSLTLGGALGPQSFSATAAGFSVAIPATATAATPSAITIVSGNNQTDSVRKTLAPLSVRVADRFGNAVSGATVNWTRASGGGSLASATSTTNADGIATNTYTLGTTTGSESVTASITGASVTFSFTTTAGGPATIAVVSGSGQTGRVGQALASPFVVRVNDVAGNAVSGGTVSWTATNGTIAASTATDASGQASATLTGGTALGGASATARIANGQSVSFTATLQAGFVSQIAFTTQPANGTQNAVLSPVRVALRDAGGNATAAINAVTIALGNNPNGAALTGTLTRNAVNGVATFDDLRLDRAGTGYTLVATSGSLPSITSTAFNTISASAAQLILVPATPTSFTKTAGGAVTNPPSLKTADANGGAVPNTPVRFVITQGASTVADVTLTSNASGLIDAANLVTPDVAGVYTITGSLVSTPSATLSVTLTVIAGSADHMSVGPAILVGDANASVTSFPQTIGVTVQDAFNNPVQGFSVRWSRSFCALGFSLASSSSTSDASGVATIGMTVPAGGPGSCRVSASLNGPPPSAVAPMSRRPGASMMPPPLTDFTFVTIMRPAGSNAWTGNVDADYENASNWTGGVPTNTSPVYVAGATFQRPSLGVDGVAGSITMEPGGGSAISLNLHTLTVSGAVDASSGGINNGTLNIQAASAANIRGVLPTTVVGSAGPCVAYTLNGTTSAGPLTVNCSLQLNGQSLTLAGGLSVATSSGRLVMTNAADYLLVNGAATFAGASEDGFLTAGTLELRSDFSQSNVVSSNSFRATGSHLTSLRGLNSQTVSFTSTAGSSQFNDLSVENMSAGGVTFTSIGNTGRDLSIGEINGNTVRLTLNQTFNVGGNLNAKAGALLSQSGVGKRIIVTGAVLGNALADFGGVDSVRIVGTTFPVYNNTTAGKAPRVTHLTPSSTMAVGANETIAGGLVIDGPVSLNGKALVVKDSFLLKGGSFDMSNTAGTLTVGGNFIQLTGTMNPSSGSLVTLNGTGTQLISFVNASDNFFGSLDITNTSSGGVQLSTNAATNGNLRVRAGARLSVPASKTLTVGPSFTLFLHDNSTIDVAGTVSFSTCQKGTGVTITGAGSSGLSTGCSSSGSLP